MPVEDTVLTMDDITQVVNFLVEMRKGERGSDDIDHLGNRRVKSIGEQLTNQFSVALSRMLRTIYERMNLREQESITPQDLINSRVVTTVINTFLELVSYLNLVIKQTLLQKSLTKGESLLLALGA